MTIAQQLARHPNCRAMMKLHGINDPTYGLTLDLTDDRVVGLLIVRLVAEAVRVTIDQIDHGCVIVAARVGDVVTLHASASLGEAVANVLLQVWS